MVQYFLIQWLQWLYAAAAAKSLQLCPTQCDPIDGSPPGSPVPGILQARTLEWVATSFSNAWKWKVKVKSLSRVQLFVTPWIAAYQAPPSMGFSRQAYWSGMPLPSLQVHPRLTESGCEGRLVFNNPSRWFQCTVKFEKLRPWKTVSWPLTGSQNHLKPRELESASQKDAQGICVHIKPEPHSFRVLVLKYTKMNTVLHHV